MRLVIVMLFATAFLSGCETLGLSGKDAVDIREQVQARVTNNWSPDLYSGNPALIHVIAVMQMKPDGTLDGDPKVTVMEEGGQTDAIVQSYVESVRSAIAKSEPFPLAAEQYEMWRTIEISFNLKEESGK